LEIGSAGKDAKMFRIMMTRSKWKKLSNGKRIRAKVNGEAVTLYFNDAGFNIDSPSEIKTIAEGECKVTLRGGEELLLFEIFYSQAGVFISA
jgi:hypothetical protein